MLRALKYFAWGLIAIVILPITATLLFWLGRDNSPAEITFGDYDDNDPGKDVDDAE